MLLSIYYNIGMVVLFGIFVRDGVMIIQLKLEQVENQKREERKRQEKLRGIFYTPGKGTSSSVRTGGGRSLSAVGGASEKVGKREGGSGREKSKSMFAFR